MDTFQGLCTRLLELLLANRSDDGKRVEEGVIGEALVVRFLQMDKIDIIFF